MSEPISKTTKPADDMAFRRIDAEIEHTMKRLSMLLQQREAMRVPQNTDHGPLMLIDKKRAVDPLRKSS